MKEDVCYLLCRVLDLNLDDLDDCDYLDNLDEDVLSTSFAGSLICMSTLRLTSSSFDTEIPLTPSISHKFRG